MKLQRMKLINFRCFGKLEINFDDRLTVIIGNNGAGKTALLDAITFGFGRYLMKLPGVTGMTSKSTDLLISKNELKEPIMIASWDALTFKGEKISWSAGRKRDKTLNNAALATLNFNEEQVMVGLKKIDVFSTELGVLANENQPFFLPVVAYYGTNRAIRDAIKRRRGFKKQFSRFDALQGALNADSHFRSAFEWFDALEDLERRQKIEQNNLSYKNPELEFVKKAINGILGEEYSNPRIELRPIRFLIDKQLDNGEKNSLRIEQLSDGYRTMLGLVMDLARRMVQANTGNLPDTLKDKSPLELPAIVLIDEIDLHLHPTWQQRILQDLKRVFSNTQFIVTTHSPQVLSTICKENIRVLDKVGDTYTISAPTFSPLAHESGDALAYLMNTHPNPKLPISQSIQAYEQLVRQGLEESGQGKKLRQQIDAEGYEFSQSDLDTWRFLARHSNKNGVKNG